MGKNSISSLGRKLDEISALARAALRIKRLGGWGSLFSTVGERVRIKARQSGLAKSWRTTLPEKWLQDNRNNFSNPFYILLKHLLDLDMQLQNTASISCADYRNYFSERCVTSGFPFEIQMDVVEDRQDIIEFIGAYDHAYLGKMVQNVFISLIRFLSDVRGNINLLDFGTGPSCGMFGEGGRFLFDIGKVNIDSINFFGIDDLHKPQGAIFKKSAYRQCNILSFTPEERFDLITGHHVLEHCANWEEVITHVSGLLKQDGYLYLSFPRFGGFYDTAYRLMSPFDHCANFDIDMLTRFSRTVGLELCMSDVYVDPNGRFNWICNIYPNLVSSDMADCFYDLCVKVDSRLPLGYHHYGHFVVFRKL